MVETWRVQRRRLQAYLVAFALLLAVPSATARAGAGGRVRLTVWKSRREMVLVADGRVVRRFRIALGSVPSGTKRLEGDGRTPVGHYRIVEKRPSRRFRWFLGIDYPNGVDADRGYALGLIGPGEWADIFLAHLRGQRPPWTTALGGQIGIHGAGGRPAEVDWTEGCIAVSDAEIDYLAAHVPLGTVVEILP